MTHEICEILARTTTVFRKGPMVVERNAGSVHVTEVFGYLPEGEAPPGLVQVDVHFVSISVDPVEAEACRAEVEAYLRSYPHQDQLFAGPSYIPVGAVLGSQEAALRLFALGEVLGYWKVFIPERFGVQGDEAARLAGLGYVLIMPEARLREALAEDGHAGS